MDAFTIQGRTPRPEYSPGVCPAVQPALLTAGFTAERQLPIMVGRPAEALGGAPPPGSELFLMTETEEPGTPEARRCRTAMTTAPA